jgi:hypothetical protein
MRANSFAIFFKTRQSSGTDKIDLCLMLVRSRKIKELLRETPGVTELPFRWDKAKQSLFQPQKLPPSFAAEKIFSSLIGRKPNPACFPAHLILW